MYRPAVLKPPRPLPSFAFIGDWDRRRNLRFNGKSTRDGYERTPTPRCNKRSVMNARKKKRTPIKGGANNELLK